jgi:phosphate butyryltransferase
MPLARFQNLFDAADRLERPVPVVAAGGADATVIQALETARRRGWVRPILTGPRDRIAELAASLDIDLDPFEVIEEEPDSARLAVEQVHSGQARLLMKGQIATPSLMKAVLDRETGLRTLHPASDGRFRTIAQVVLMEIVRDDRRFLMTDTGITIAPTLEQKRDLVESVVETARKLGCDRPRVALMSATEKVTQALPDTLDAEQLVRLGEGGTFGDCLVQGPLSFDLAYASDAGMKKGISGEVTGAADALVFPDLLSANLTVKGIMYTADCRFGGILTGTACPVVFMSRADSVETRLNSLAYALSLIEPG